MPKTNRPIVQVALYCCKCKTQQAIWRLDGRLRDKNHVKHMWCHRCNKKTAHFQIED